MNSKKTLALFGCSGSRGLVLLEHMEKAAQKTQSQGRERSRRSELNGSTSTFQFRLLTRNPAVVTVSPCVDVMQGSMMSVDDVARVMSGCEAALLHSPTEGGEVFEIQAAAVVAQGAKRASLSLLVYVSLLQRCDGRSTGSPPLNTKKKVENRLQDELADSGVRLVVLRVGRYLDELCSVSDAHIIGAVGVLPSVVPRQGSSARFTALTELAGTILALVASASPSQLDRAGTNRNNDKTKHQREVEVFNVGDACSYSRSALLASIRRVSGRRWVLELPDLLLRILLRLAIYACSALRNERMLAYALLLLALFEGQFGEVGDGDRSRLYAPNNALRAVFEQLDGRKHLEANMSYKPISLDEHMAMVFKTAREQRSSWRRRRI